MYTETPRTINRKGLCIMGYEIIPVRGHYEVYDNRGNFICSADTRYEAFSELEEADELL